VGDRVKDALAGREGIITDVENGEYVLRPLRGPVVLWRTTSDEHLMIVVPRGKGVDS
jgi:hypothetical protein